MYTDKKILELIEILVTRKVIRFHKNFYEAINFLPQNLIKNEKGEAHFMPEHIRMTCVKFKVDANWVMGLGKRIISGGA